MPKTSPFQKEIRELNHLGKDIIYCIASTSQPINEQEIINKIALYTQSHSSLNTTNDRASDGISYMNAIYKHLQSEGSGECLTYFSPKKQLLSLSFWQSLFAFIKLRSDIENGHLLRSWLEGVVFYYCQDLNDKDATQLLKEYVISKNLNSIHTSYQLSMLYFRSIYYHRTLSEKQKMRLAILSSSFYELFDLSSVSYSVKSLAIYANINPAKTLAILKRNEKIESILSKDCLSPEVSEFYAQVLCAMCYSFRGLKLSITRLEKLLKMLALSHNPTSVQKISFLKCLSDLVQDLKAPSPFEPVPKTFLSILNSYTTDLEMKVLIKNIPSDTSSNALGQDHKSFKI